MTIAGTDSGAGAGVAADLKAFAAQRVHGVFAVTVVTAQNTMGVRDVHPIPTPMIAAQIDAVVEDFTVAATKTGLLWGEAVVRSVAERTSGLGRLVVDPVLVNARRERIQPPEVDAAYLETLFDNATVLTPNVAEAELLTGRTIANTGEARDAAEQLQQRGVPHVVVTGLLASDAAVDVWAGPAGTVELAEPLVETPNIHGTGCSFAATIAARMAKGEDAEIAIPEAKHWVAAAIRSAATWRLGGGQGPIDHFIEAT
jgi:hydroxymethylpyrimidine/phosphomethylpyrimidine kinase